MANKIFQWFLDHYKFPYSRSESLRNITPFTLQELAVSSRQIGQFLTEEELLEAIKIVQDVPLDDIFEECLLRAIERVRGRS